MWKKWVDAHLDWWDKWHKGWPWPIALIGAMMIVCWPVIVFGTILTIICSVSIWWAIGAYATAIFFTMLIEVWRLF